MLYVLCPDLECLHHLDTWLGPEIRLDTRDTVHQTCPEKDLSKYLRSLLRVVEMEWPAGLMVYRLCKLILHQDDGLDLQASTWPSRYLTCSEICSFSIILVPDLSEGS